MSQVFKTIASDVLNIIFPNNCVCCNKKLESFEKCICLKCYYDLPKTKFQNDDTNPVQQSFWGRVHIEMATAYFYYNIGSKYQKLLHMLKYSNRTDIGEELGIQLGHDLKTSKFFNNLDMIIPVPLHPKKEAKRGYNQSFFIATGIESVIKVPVNTKILKRVEDSSTQTNKSRGDRWDNVERVFKMENPAAITGKHILLVDDVTTTGATLEACAAALLKAENVKVSIATLAYATN